MALYHGQRVNRWPMIKPSSRLSLLFDQSYFRQIVDEPTPRLSTPPSSPVTKIAALFGKST